MTQTTNGSGSTAGSTSGARAKRKAAGGLTVERIYTTPGVHPYDEVTWERRDVVMTELARRLDQLRAARRRVPGLLVGQRRQHRHDQVLPRRGRTPSRARPVLRQLIDRVVADLPQGRRGATATSRPPQDAEIFEHELTWMLLHQVFSFNSPVWFNVGTDAPQQV